MAYSPTTAANDVSWPRYGYNFWCGYDGGGFTKANKLSSPSQKIMLADPEPRWDAGGTGIRLSYSLYYYNDLADNIAAFTYRPKSLPFNHKMRPNLVFFDGHGDSKNVFTELKDSDVKPIQ